MASDKFLEDEGTGEKKKKNAAKTGAKGKPVTSKSDSSDIEEVESAEQTISLFLAIGMVVGALVVGLIVGYVVAPRGSAAPGVVEPTGGQAPSLSPDQLKNGQLPSGHPPVGGAPQSGAGTSTGSEAPAAPSGEKTDNKTE